MFLVLQEDSTPVLSVTVCTDCPEDTVQTVQKTQGCVFIVKILLNYTVSETYPPLLVPGKHNLTNYFHLQELQKMSFSIINGEISY